MSHRVLNAILPVCLTFCTRKETFSLDSRCFPNRCVSSLFVISTKMSWSSCWSKTKAAKNRASWQLGWLHTPSAPRSRSTLKLASVCVCRMFQRSSSEVRVVQCALCQSVQLEPPPWTPLRPMRHECSGGGCLFGMTAIDVPLPVGCCATGSAIGSPLETYSKQQTSTQPTSF